LPDHPHLLQVLPADQSLAEPAPMNLGGFRFSPPINDSLRNNALTAFLVLESLILFVGAPLSAIGVKAPVLLGGLICAPVLLLIVVISRSTGARLLTLVATILAISGAVLRITHPSVVTVWLGHAAVIAAALGISVVIVRAVFAPGPITHHRIAGAIILYLNIALVLTSVFRLLQELNPDAFAHIPVHQAEAVSATTMLYFSFTALTSTGFGDILPVDPFARSMVNLETILGQLYLTTLLARLVSMHLESR
jgi:voltage-gated potassium channel Kch